MAVSPAAIREIAEALAQRYLEPYLAAAKGRQYSRKEVNDSLWGTIVLTPIEVAVLDSPLLQRLRSVRQLGVVHWVYPGAVHTRFEHTLGMLFQIQQLIAALNTAWKLQQPEAANAPPLIDDKWGQLLRLCALLHDVGQAAFSQTSESALEGLSDFLTLSSDFTKELLKTDRGEDTQLSEILAFYIVQSRAMRELFCVLLGQYAPEVRFDGDPERNARVVLGKVARALIGRRIDDSLPLLHELVSGPYGADRLDQLVRDARFAGTPSLLDIPRLIQKLAVRSMRAKDLPQDIGGQISGDPEGRTWLFGIKLSGASVLDELQLAQILAFTKIYRHPKVVAVEQMVRTFIESVSDLVAAERLLSFLYSQADDAILGLSRAALAEALGLDIATLDDRKQAQLVRAEATLQAIRERRLWVQAFQFPGSYHALQDHDPRSAGLNDLLEKLRHPVQREEFMDLVRAEVRTMFRLLDGEQGSGKPPSDPMIMISVPGQIAGETQTGRAFLIDKTSVPVPLARSMKVRGNWSEQYMSDQPRAYIFSAPETADMVYLAVERVVRVELGVRLPGLFADASKRDGAELLQLRRRLDAVGYWTGAPFDIRPLAERLERVDIWTTINDFDQLRDGFQEPPADESEDRISPDIPSDRRTMAWLRQFGDSEHAACALTLLKYIKLLTRNDTADALREFFSSAPQFKGAWVVPFGGIKDSSVVETHFATDVGKDLIESVGTLEDYAKHGEKKPLVFLDNFIASGGQAVDVLAAWFGRDDLRKPDLHEEREPLDPEIVELLCRIPVAFVFVAGWKDGVDAVRTITEKLKIDATVHCYLKEDQLPFARQCLLDEGHEEAQVDSFLARCKQIGRDLLNSAKRETPLDAAKAEQRELGYGNRGMLLATLGNVPTQSLTAIWMPGQVDEADWTPLMRRRKKK